MKGIICGAERASRMQKIGSFIEHLVIGFYQ